MRRILHFFLRLFDEILSGVRDKFQRRVTCVAFWSKFAKKLEKLLIAENSEICENYSIIFNIISPGNALRALRGVRKELAGVGRIQALYAERFRRMNAAATKLQARGGPGVSDQHIG